MCGIAGVLHRDGRPASPVTLKAMTDIIAHRGPDGEGHYCDGPVGLGHRRLSIIDLTDAARQPMATRDGRYVLSYNGEIYNFKELKAELSARGHLFHSSGDSEVLLTAFAEWGISALLRLNGMAGLLITGVIMWRSLFSQYFSLGTIRVASLVHAVLALALMLLVIVHVYSSFWIKGSIDAMLTGWVTPGWAYRHHRRWYRKHLRGEEPQSHAK